MITSAVRPEHISLGRLTERDAEQEAARILAGAFAVDPVLQHCIPQEKRRSQVLTLLYEKTTRIALSMGGVELLSGRASALWLEGRMDAPFLLALRLGFFRVLWEMGVRALVRLIRHEHYCASRAKNLGPKRYGYVWVLGVMPTSQGQGWGQATLTRALNALSRRGHTVCLLKTESEGNVAFYKKCGFTCIDTVVVPSSGIRYWLLQKQLTAERIETIEESNGA
jgi:ribosomal protein S18 acetylase RimI-like enzyme